MKNLHYQLPSAHGPTHAHRSDMAREADTAFSEAFGGFMVEAATKGGDKKTVESKIEQTTATLPTPPNPRTTTTTNPHLQMTETKISKREGGRERIIISKR